MFRLTSDISIGFRRVKPAKVVWKSSVGSLNDSCVIVLPRRAYLHDSSSLKDSAPKVAGVNVGDPVNVSLGYNGNNTPRFKGFVTRITLGAEMQIECIGYMYKLREVRFTKSYKKTTLKQILTDLINGSGVVLSQHTVDVIVTNVTFKEAPADKVLEWVQKELLCTVSFYDNVLYAGVSKYGVPREEVKLSLGYNTVSDNELKKVTQAPNNNIVISIKSKTGTVKKYKKETAKYSNVKTYNVRPGLEASYIKALQTELSKREHVDGNQGSITTFLEPPVSKGDTIKIIDNRYGVRGGIYFAESVDGSYGSSGGRQKVVLKYIGNG